jgi:hypothetical protein
VPAAMVADVALTVVGDINPSSVSVDDRLVINGDGEWVGPAAGLQGPQGPQGTPGAAGGAADPADVVPLVVRAVQDDPAVLPYVQRAGDTVTGLISFSGRSTSDALNLANANIRGVNFLEINDPGPTEGIRWRGTAAKIVVSPANEANADGLLRLINDGAISLESDVELEGHLQVLGGVRVGTAQACGGDQSGTLRWTGAQIQICDGAAWTTLISDGAAILAALQGVDGAGSGLDADRLDNLDSSVFMRADRDTGSVGLISANSFTVRDNEMGGARRNWMVDGLRIGGGGSDGAYFGMKFEGANNSDTVIAWGDDVGDDLRFIFSRSGGAVDGEEAMRIVGASGNVGIGTTVPQARLDVRGGLRIGDTALCNAARAGTLRWNNNLLQACDGAAWRSFSPSPQQVRDLLVQADGAGSGVDADRLDGLDSGVFMRADRNTGSIGLISGNSFTVRDNEMGGSRRNWMVDGLRIGGGGSDGAYFGMKDEGDNNNDTVVAWGDDVGDDLRFIFTRSGGAADGEEAMRIIGDSGNIGMGTAAPTAKLDVRGGVRLGTHNACDAASAGVVRFLNGRFEGCTGSEWKYLDVSGIQPGLDLPGLLAHYRFEGNYLDSAGNLDGSGGGAAAFEATGLGRAVRFNGIGGANASRSWVQLPSINPRNAITVVGWIRSAENGRYGGVWQLISNYSAYILGTGGWDSNLVCFIPHTAGWDYGTCYAVPDPQSWHHFVGSYDSASGQIKLYVDGVLRDTGNAGAGQLMTADAGTVDLGHRECCDHGNMNGWMDEVQFYDRALSDQEVSNLYESYNGLVR